MTKLQGTLFDDLPASVGVLSKHPLYSVWYAMRARCYSPSNPRFHRYGERGITVCDEWRASSRAFVAWAIKAGWKPGLQLDRENNDGPYSPGNCRFVSPKANARNRGDCLRLPDGRCVLDVAEQNGLPGYLARSRVARGWPVEEACGLVPPRPHHRALLLDDGRVAAHVARDNGIPRAVWRRRVAQGWSVEQAVLVPWQRKRPDGRKPQLLLSDGTPAIVAAARAGLPRSTVYGRVRLGWSLSDAVSVPKGGKRPSATVRVALGESAASAQGDKAQRPAALSSRKPKAMSVRTVYEKRATTAPSGGCHRQTGQGRASAT